MDDSRNDFPAMPDGLIASGLVTAPAWATWLNEINQVLTTASLGIGLLLGAARLWLLLRQHHSKHDQK